VRRLLDGLFNRSPELLLTHLVRGESLDRVTLERLRDLVETELAVALDSPGSRTVRSPRRKEA